MPTYHRLDVGLNFTKQKKHGVRTWSIGAYNAYNRKNAFMVYQDEKWDSGKQELVPVLKQVTIFPVIPYFKYTFKF